MFLVNALSVVGKIRVIVTIQKIVSFVSGRRCMVCVICAIFCGHNIGHRHKIGICVDCLIRIGIWVWNWVWVRVWLTVSVRQILETSDRLFGIFVLGFSLTRVLGPALRLMSRAIRLVQVTVPPLQMEIIVIPLQISSLAILTLP